MTAIDKRRIFPPRKNLDSFDSITDTEEFLLLCERYLIIQMCSLSFLLIDIIYVLITRTLMNKKYYLTCNYQLILFVRFIGHYKLIFQKENLFFIGK